MDPRQSNIANRLAPILMGLVAITFFMVKGCDTGPFGRRQIRGMSAEQEVTLGMQAFQQTLKESEVINSGPLVETVRNITRRLASASLDDRFLKSVRMKAQKMGWDVRLVRSKQVNAFCLPGGKMVVYTGIIPVAQTEAGLATVMGHEIAHALAHHGAERMAHQQMAQIGVGAAGMALGDMDHSSRMRVMQVLNAGAQFGIMSYGRGHESEADHVGLFLMATAGYDPRESLRFWERMKQASGGGGAPPEFMSTHPSHATRIQDLAKWMPEAMTLYDGSNKVPDRPLPRQ